jgi:adenosylcobinamide-GDP ribazoletransferase
MHGLDYARREGLGTAFRRHPDSLRFGLMSGAALLAILSLAVAGLQGLAAAVLALGLVLGWRLFLRQRIAGWTGDTLGAACELAEAALALGLAVGGGGP